MPQYRMFMYNLGRGNNPFSAPVAEMVTTDAEKFLAWVGKLEAEGWVQQPDYEAHVNMLRSMGPKRELQTNGVFVRTNNKGIKKVTRVPFDPATRANRASGKGEKPMPKPTRDYQGSQMPKGEWTPTHSPGTGSSVSTKRFPHLGGQTGPQARGE